MQLPAGLGDVRGPQGSAGVRLRQPVDSGGVHPLYGGGQPPPGLPQQRQPDLAVQRALAQHHLHLPVHLLRRGKDGLFLGQGGLPPLPRQPGLPHPDPGGAVHRQPVGEPGRLRRPPPRRCPLGGADHGGPGALLRGGRGDPARGAQHQVPGHLLPGAPGACLRPAGIRPGGREPGQRPLFLLHPAGDALPPLSGASRPGAASGKNRKHPQRRNLGNHQHRPGSGAAHPLHGAHRPVDYPPGGGLLHPLPRPEPPGYRPLPEAL